MGDPDIHTGAVLAILTRLTDVALETRDAVGALADWLQQPPKSETAEMVRALVSSIADLQGEVRKGAAQTAALGQTILQLSARIAEMRDAMGEGR
jgi:hypothetical protein